MRGIDMVSYDAAYASSLVRSCSSLIEWKFRMFSRFVVP
jgi:hypothetical protein